jgi:hypothetical protein
MKKFAFAALLLLVCASPAFARHKKAPKDPRVVEHPKALHEKNQHFKEKTKIKPRKHANA